MIDASCFCGQWPFRPLPAETPEALERLLEGHGIDGALVSPVEGILYDEPQLANERLFDQLRDYPTLHPVAIVNPGLSNWKASLEACASRYGIKAVRLLANYHLYDLADSVCHELLDAAGEMRLPVILQLRIQDVRTQNRRVPVPDVEVARAVEAAKAHPSTRFVLGAVRWNELMPARAALSAMPNLWLDLSCVEYTDVLRTLIASYGTRQILFGTHTPFYVLESAILKLREAELSEEEREAITERNAQELFHI